MASVLDLAWLAGTWQCQDDDNGSIEEVWGTPQSDTLMGMLRQFKNDVPQMYELFLIEQNADSIVLRIKHFGDGLIAWEDKAEMKVFQLVTITDNTARFRLAYEDGRKRYITYQYENDVLTLTVEFADLDSSKTEVYSYHRQQT